MKTMIRSLLLLTMMITVIAVHAQRRTVEERVAVVHAKFDSTFHLEAGLQTKVDAAFATYYRAQDSIRAEMRSGGERPDFQEMRAKMQPAMDSRDKQLQTLLSAEQFRKWKDEIEPALAPQRPGRRN